MFDLFNRKKLKRLEEKNTKLIEENEEINNYANALLEALKEKNSTSGAYMLLESNKCLIEWIEKILENFGTMNVNDSHVSIPILKREFSVYKGVDTLFDEVSVERIVIPAITIEKRRI